MAPAERDALRLRIVSAVVLAPVAIAAAWFGSPWLAIVTAAAGAAMAWEWARLCRGGRLGVSGATLIAAVLAAIAAAATDRLGIAIAVIVIGAAVVWSLARREPGSDATWLAAGAIWVTVPCVLLLWLAHPDGIGRHTVLWLFAIVWATDIGAYAIGRSFGGPRLAPRWSPRKTWSGLIGGIACAAAAGWGTARLLGISPALPVVAISAALAIVEQFGDLAESAAKRRFGVKDTSGLIPGHGGLLDRLDGLLAVVPAAALLTVVLGGGILTWR